MPISSTGASGFVKQWTKTTNGVGILRTTAAVFIVAVALNYPWEMAQAFLFAPMGSVREASWRCFVASLGDGVMILTVGAAGWLVFRHRLWFQQMSFGRVAFVVSVGALIGMAVEWWGLSTGRWQYAASMPQVAGLGLGWVPLMQMPVLAPLVLWLTTRCLESFSGH